MPRTPLASSAPDAGGTPVARALGREGNGTNGAAGAASGWAAVRAFGDEIASRSAHAQVVWAHALGDAARREATRLARSFAAVPGGAVGAASAQSLAVGMLDAWLVLVDAYARACVRKASGPLGPGAAR